VDLDTKIPACTNNAPNRAEEKIGRKARRGGSSIFFLRKGSDKISNDVRLMNVARRGFTGAYMKRKAKSTISWIINRNKTEKEWEKNSGVLLAGLFLVLDIVKESSDND